VPSPSPARDLRRLRRALGRRRVDLGASLFGPDSLTWRINREAVLLLGGGRALLMQVAHPLVAAGVAEHSNFRVEALQRLRRTLDLTLTVAFDDAVSGLQAVRQIERIHGRVHGVLARPVGSFPSGTPYDANDPRLLFWVHATLFDSALSAYERFVAPLSAAERRAYYEESKITARLFGIPDEWVPASWREFRAYMRRMLVSGELAIDSTARDIAASILDPPLPFGLHHAARPMRLFTVGLLPPRLRREYGFAWGPGRERVLAAATAGIRLGLPLLPARLRYFPAARRALF
jgi:uncharacterized protein (DUF2236 family)